MNLGGDATKDYFGTMTGIETANEVHRQPQGEQFAEHAVHGTGARVTSTAVPSFTVELDCLFAA